MRHPHLLVMAKFPIKGQVKTRLAATLGDDGALAVYRQLLARTAHAVADWPGGVTVHTAGSVPSSPIASTPSVTDWPLAAYPSQAQCAETNLGQRLAYALNQHISHGPCLIIGTDCPGISQQALAASASALQTADVVCGPAKDGGYWCLGCADHQAVAVTCAADLPWSQANLLQVTQQRCAQHQLRWATGPTLADCDTADDYQTAVAAKLLTPVK